MNTLILFETFESFPLWFLIKDKQLTHLDETIINVTGNQSAEDELVKLIYDKEGKYNQEPISLAAAIDAIRTLEGKLVVIKCGMAL